MLTPMVRQLRQPLYLVTPPVQRFEMVDNRCTLRYKSFSNLGSAVGVLKAHSPHMQLHFSCRQTFGLTRSVLIQFCGYFSQGKLFLS